jgi:hypothetical protein
MESTENLCGTMKTEATERQRQPETAERVKKKDDGRRCGSGTVGGRLGYEPSLIMLEIIDDYIKIIDDYID